MRDSEFCFWHAPEHEADRTEAQRLGRLRRRREVAMAGAFDFVGLLTVADIRRLLEMAAFDTLGLDNSVPRSRTLVAVAVAAAKLLETGELEERVKTLEAAVLARKELPTSAFEAGFDDPFLSADDNP